MATIRPVEGTQETDTRSPQNGWSTGTGEKLDGNNVFGKEYTLRGAETGTTFDSLEKPGLPYPAYLDEEGGDWNAPPETARDLVTEVIHAWDDPTLSPWTFRMWFLGIGLSAFGGVLSTIYYFKPQTLGVSTIFLGCISYILGEAMSHLIPRVGFVGRWLNPHPVGLICKCLTPYANKCAVQSQRTCRHHDHVKYGIQCPISYGSPRSNQAVLQQSYQSFRRIPVDYLDSVPGIWYCRGTPQRIDISHEDAISFCLIHYIPH
jgi:OPT oligopeptide transporter protein